MRILGSGISNLEDSKIRVVDTVDTTPIASLDRERATLYKYLERGTSVRDFATLRLVHLHRQHTGSTTSYEYNLHQDVLLSSPSNNLP
jgi:hypothetical protein